MQSEMNFYKFDRAEWSQFHSQNFTSVTDAELAQLRSLNDEISLDDVKTIYSPLRHLIHIRYEDYQGDMFTLSRFLGMQRNPHTPFIIGIAGSVAVGKSTTARLLQLLLSRAYPDKRVQQITTDGFLYPNAELERRGILVNIFGRDRQHLPLRSRAFAHAFSSDERVFAVNQTWTRFYAKIRTLNARTR